MWLSIWLACTPLGLEKECVDCMDTGVAEPSGEPETNWPVNPDTGDTQTDTDVDTSFEDTADVDDTGLVDETGDTEPVEPAECDWTIYDRARDYAAQYPKRDGGSWSGWCASLMWRFGDMPESSARASAIIAYGDSNIVGTDPRLAPIGAFHWWDIGVYGHVAVDLLGGGTTVFMASNYVVEDWGDAIGVTSIPRYTNATGATYLGWSMDYANALIANGGGAVCDGHQYHMHAGTVPVTNTAETGVPNASFYMRMQLFGSLYNYTGPIDGVMGTNSWKGVQRGLDAMGYNVSISGIPDSDTYAAMQSVGALYGYTGPVDGIMGPNSYRGFSKFLNAEL